MTNGYLGIEITERHVYYVYLFPENGGYSVHRAGKLPSKVNFSVAGGLSNVIEDILNKENIAPRRMFLTINRSDTVIQQTELPHLERSELKQIIQMEIGKNSVFFQREFDYVFRDYPSDNGRSLVVSGAMDKNYLQYIFNDIRGRSFTLEEIEISPLNLKELIPVSNPSRLQGFLAVGDHHSYLGLLENNQYKMLYKSTMGLKQFTSTPKEEGKKYLIARWIRDIRQKIEAFYETGGKKVDLLWLVWDKQAVPDLDERIAKEIGIDLEVFYVRKVRGVKTTEEHQLNPVYLNALTPVLCYLDRVKTDFPIHHFFRGTQRKWEPIGVVAAVLAVTITAAGLLFHARPASEKMSSAPVSPGQGGQDVSDPDEVSVREQMAKILPQGGELNKIILGFNDQKAEYFGNPFQKQSESEGASHEKVTGR